MNRVEDYFLLLTEYERIHAEVLHSLVMTRSEPAHELHAQTVAAWLDTRSALAELRQHVERAAASSPGSQEQSQSEAALLRAAEAFDDIVYRILRSGELSGEWKRHQDTTRSIVGRWPGVPPKRARDRG